MGPQLWPDHRLPHLKQNDMPMHEYISKFANLVKHAYGLSPTAHIGSHWSLPLLRVS